MKIIMPRSNLRLGTKQTVIARRAINPAARASPEINFVFLKESTQSFIHQKEDLCYNYGDLYPGNIPLVAGITTKRHS